MLRLVSPRLGMDPPVTEPATLAGNRLHLFANFRIIGRTVTPNSFRIDANMARLMHLSGSLLKKGSCAAKAYRVSSA